MKTVLKTLALIVSAAVAFTALPSEAQAASSLRYVYSKHLPDACLRLWWMITGSTVCGQV